MLFLDSRSDSITYDEKGLVPFNEDGDHPVIEGIKRFIAKLPSLRRNMPPMHEEEDLHGGAD